MEYFSVKLFGAFLDDPSQDKDNVILTATADPLGILSLLCE